MLKPKTDVEEKALAIAVEHYIEDWSDRTHFETYKVLSEGEDLAYDGDTHMDTEAGIDIWEPKFLAGKIDQLYRQIVYTFEEK